MTDLEKMKDRLKEHQELKLWLTENMLKLDEKIINTMIRIEIAEGMFDG